MMMVGWVLATAVAPVPVAMERVDLSAHSLRSEAIVATPIASTAGHPPDAASSQPAWPATPPALTARGSRFSPLYRARDVLDTARWPARATAKLFRLNDDGTREGSACTASFVGPRHLVTAGHCVIDPATGRPHSGLELAVGYDAGQGVGTPVAVVRSWFPSALLGSMAGAAARVTADRCDDFAVVEIAEPRGATTGWLGMRDHVPVAGPDDRLLYRFSYPNQSAVVTLAATRDRPETPPAIRMALDAAIARARATEPDFAPDSLYFDYGRADLAEGLYVAERSGNAVPGRSGSALLDDTGAIVAVMSRSGGGLSYSCRLDSAAIGAIEAIVDRPA